MTPTRSTVKSFLATLAGIALVVLLVTGGYDQFVTEPRQNDFDERQGELLDIARDLCGTAEGLRVVVLAFPPPNGATPAQLAAYEDLGTVDCSDP